MAMDEQQLMAWLREAENLPDEAARERWLAALPEEVRQEILRHAQAYAEAVFESASDHLWAAEKVFDPLSRGEEPDKPLPVLRLDLPGDEPHA